jgi:hypothetical protein
MSGSKKLILENSGFPFEYLRNKAIGTLDSQKVWRTYKLAFKCKDHLFERISKLIQKN